MCDSSPQVLLNGAREYSNSLNYNVLLHAWDTFVFIFSDFVGVKLHNTLCSWKMSEMTVY